MRGVLWVGGIVIFGVVILIIVPSFTVQNAGNATLVQINSTNILGTASLSPVQGGQATLINVQVQRLVPDSTYALSIRGGSCYGDLLTALQPASTDNSGNGSSSTTLSAQIQSSWFIVLHSGPTTRNAVLACGQVVLNAVVTAPGPPTSNPSYPPNNTPNMPGQFPDTGGGPPKQP
jgi:hypothetical protein